MQYQMPRTSSLQVMSTHQKALSVNLDSRRYGTFAEIGAGREVVRWFFRVGGAAGTIAKSMSACDMKVSDAIYGRAIRYVCLIIIPVRMRDTEMALQQEALGIVGVNLVYGALAFNHEPELLIDSLLDGLSTSRIEIDMIEFSGIAFRRVDNRLMSLKLVQSGLGGVAMFAANGAVLQPSEFLYRKPIFVERGSFRPVCNVNLDMLQCAHEKFSQLPEVKGNEVAQITEITMRNLKAKGEIDRRDFLARAEVMAALGMNLLISVYFEYYRLAAYLS